jgi:peptidyl-prolyl cis-trans isomerase C
VQKDFTKNVTKSGYYYMNFSNHIQNFRLNHHTQIKIFWTILILVGLIFLVACQSQSKPTFPAEKRRELANAFYNQQLYHQAVAEYIDYLNQYPLDDKEQANISYMIANIYYERLYDYENALAYYLRLKYLYPESNLQTEAGRKMVECLERLKRSTDAQQLVEQTAALDESQKPASRPGETIARIGNRQITTGDLQYELGRLPVYMREQFHSPEKKVAFLKEYIVQELLFDSAKRKGLDKDRDVREGIRQAEKSLMAQKLLQQEIEKESKLDNYTNADVELYYKANKDKYTEKDEAGKVIKTPSFGEVQERVAQDFIQQKQQEAYSNLVERLMKTKDVQIYENKFK